MKTKGRRQSKNVIDVRKTSSLDVAVSERSGDKLMSKTRMKNNKGSRIDKIRNVLLNPGRLGSSGPLGETVSKPTKFKRKAKPKRKS